MGAGHPYRKQQRRKWSRGRSGRGTESTPVLTDLMQQQAGAPEVLGHHVPPHVPPLPQRHRSCRARSSAVSDERPVLPTPSFSDFDGGYAGELQHLSSCCRCRSSCICSAGRLCQCSRLLPPDAILCFAKRQGHVNGTRSAVTLPEHAQQEGLHVQPIALQLS